MKVSNLLLCLTVISLASMLYGQGGATGTILGTVTDNTGAVAGVHFDHEGPDLHSKLGAGQWTR